MRRREIGAKVEIPISAIDAKRDLDGDGFVLEICSDGILTMRRDFLSGTLLRPRRPE
jgi:hypothetical protein